LARARAISADRLSAKPERTEITTVWCAASVIGARSRCGSWRRLAMEVRAVTSAPFSPSMMVRPSGAASAT